VELIRLCRVLHETPPERLEAALAGLLDVDSALWFLALDNVFINGDGFWARASDYAMFQDKTGVFHVLPYDFNETFSSGAGPGGPPGGPPGPRPARSAAGPAGRLPPRPPFPATAAGPAFELDPLVLVNDAAKPLAAKLPPVPALRQRYLARVHELATRWLDWERLGPLVGAYRERIAAEVKVDTRKLDSFAAFAEGVDDHPAAAAADRTGPGHLPALRTFVEKRRAYLLGLPAVRAAAP
jgi:hypothetical protein